MATEDHPRLADYVTARREELGLSVRRAAQLAGIAYDTWRRIEGGTKKVHRPNIAKVDPVLGWAPGSAVGILEGREPIPIRETKEAPGADISRRPVADIDRAVRDVIQLATIATASGLTADEIRELSDRAVRDLKDAGLI
ncbi:helix-turn-helix domain-containing protein [Streptomyces sp. NPDC058629]|uniref:helix-turn-helix domain-containing protein n=1 Tax=Streptomyces sp. NPDC058629 TaxID=3346565 RepID=UPI003664110C